MLHETVAVAEPLLAQMPGDNLIVQLYRRTLELLALSETGHARLKVRGFYITAQLIERYAPIPAEGVVLGSEDLLCEKFSTCRATFRHALRILDDLGMLHVQRGRGGGYVLKRPHSIAVVRQMFALLAWQQQTFSDILPMKWTFDIIRVRLAMLSLGRCEPGIRKAHYDEFSLSLSQPTEPGRWCLLQQALGRAADNPLIGTFLWCLVAYQVRIGAPPVAWSEIETELFGIEQAMVCAVRGGQSADAECQHRRAQALITRLLLER
jgi:DNA-binding FadR family transcriptional regulator